MLQAVFDGRGGFALIALTAVLIAALIGYVAAKRLMTRPWAYAGLSAVFVAELSVTVFFPSPGYVSGQCVLNRSVSEPFATEQGLLNIAMFLPVGFFGVLAVRRAIPVFLGGVLLSVVTELAQALVPWAGRSCDSGDVLTNTVGAGVGSLVGWAVVRAVRGELVPLRSAAKSTAVAFVTCFVACAVVWKAWITPLAVDSTSLQITGSEEWSQARQALAEAFDDHLDVSNVQRQSGQNGASDQLLITMETGFAELSWPDREQLTVSLVDLGRPEPAGFPVTGAGAAGTADEAIRIATAYAKKRYPWALRDSYVESLPVGDDAESGWIVRWRSRIDGVIMPMRLDVRLNRAGRVCALLTRHAEAPVSLPPRRVGEKQAAAAASRSAGGARTGAGILLAVRRSGEWRAQWSIPVSAGADVYPVYVDSGTGKIDERVSPAQGLSTTPN